ncbi:MAG: hypothetical protein JW959_01055 [Pirellulales bacterium]|nr:hypothetical protein [Pirellulales bacterium]
MQTAELSACDVRRRSDGVVLVRVRSDVRQGRRLPDAIFSFRQGDPQYEYWTAQALGQTSNSHCG